MVKARSYWFVTERLTTDTICFPFTKINTFKAEPIIHLHGNWKGADSRLLWSGHSMFIPEFIVRNCWAILVLVPILLIVLSAVQFFSSSQNCLRKSETKFIILYWNSCWFSSCRAKRPRGSAVDTISCRPVKGDSVKGRRDGGPAVQWSKTILMRALTVIYDSRVQCG